MYFKIHLKVVINSFMPIQIIYFYEKYIFQTEWAKDHYYPCLLISLFRSGLIEDTDFSHLLWHSVLPYVVLTEEYWTNPGFTRICSWKGGEYILISFSDNCGHSSLTQPHNSTNGSFFKGYLWCGIWSTRFLYPLTFKCIWAHLHLKWVFLPSVICNIMCWLFGKCWLPELFRSSKCTIENPLYKSVCRAYLY